MENRRTRVIVSAEEADHHSFKKPAGRMYVTFYRCFRFDHPSPEWSSNLPVNTRLFSFPLSAFADAATARSFLDPALTALFVHFPDRFTLWKERGAAAPCLIAGASQKIAELGASIAVLSVSTSPGILVKVQKLAPVTSPGMGREEARGYFDGETEEGSRMWVSAEQITREGEADNARVEVAIDNSMKIELLCSFYESNN